MRRVLRLGSFRRLLTAYTLNELTWAIGSLSLAVYVYRRSGHALGAVAFFLCSQFGPALLSPALVGRLDGRAARRVLPPLYAGEAVLYLLLVLLLHAPVAVLLVLITLDGVLAISARALARATSAAITAPAGLLREGNAMTNVAFSICFMGGPLLAGAVVATGGTRVALLCNTGLFTVITGLLASTPGLPRPRGDAQLHGRRVRAALAYVRRQEPILALLGLRSVGIVFFTMAIPVELLLSQRTFHGGPSGYGWILAAWGGGAVAGSAIYARARHLPLRWLIGAGAGLLGAGFLVMGVAPSLGVAVAGSTVAGAGNGVENVAASTALQEMVPESWMALMLSLNESLVQGLPGAGIAIGGAVAGLTSPRAALIVAAAGALAVAAATPSALRTLRDPAISLPAMPRGETAAPGG